MIEVLTSEKALAVAKSAETIHFFKSYVLVALEGSEEIKSYKLYYVDEHHCEFPDTPATSVMGLYKYDEKIKNYLPVAFYMNNEPLGKWFESHVGTTYAVEKSAMGVTKKSMGEFEILAIEGTFSVGPVRRVSMCTMAKGPGTFKKTVFPAPNDRVTVFYDLTAPAVGIGEIQLSGGKLQGVRVADTDFTGIPSIFAFDAFVDCYVLPEK